MSRKEPALTLTGMLTYFCYIWLTGFLFLAPGRLIFYITARSAGSNAGNAGEKQQNNKSIPCGMY